MINIRIDRTAKIPPYLQIVDQVKQMVAVGKVKPGEHLPTVRYLARELNINPNTVAKAYVTLGQEHIVIARRGGGTQVLNSSGDPQLHSRHQRLLSSLVSNYILKTLKLGYKPNELETAFHLQLSRCVEQRRVSESVFIDR